MFPPEYALDWLPEWLVVVLVVSTIGVAVWKALLKPAWLGLRVWLARVQRFLEDWFGEDARPGVPGRQGVMPRLQGYDDRISGLEGAMAEYHEALADVRYHVQPNHGGSAHDALAKRMEALREQLQHLTDAQLVSAGAVDRLRDDKEKAHEEILRRLATVEQARLKLEPGEES